MGGRGQDTTGIWWMQVKAAAKHSTMTEQPKISIVP